MGSRGVERQIEEIQLRLNVARESLRVLEEQVAAWNETLDEARIRSLVSETPQLTAEYNELSKHVAVATAEMERRAQEVALLLVERDALLRQWTPKEQ